MMSFGIFGLLAFVHCAICAPLNPPAIFNGIDTNKDGQFNADDLMRTILSYDTSGDKAVTKTEFVQKFQGFNLGNANQAEIVFNLADVNDDGVVNETDAKQIALDFDRDHDGFVTEAEFVVGFRQALASATSAPTTPNPLDPANTFTAIDSNNDSSISLTEFARALNIYDINHDNITTESEFIRQFRKLGLGSASYAASLFPLADVNNDTILNDTDYEDMFHQYYDLNGDGSVDKSEFVKSFAQVLNINNTATNPLDAALIFANLDTDNDGKLNYTDFATAFGVYDINGDGETTEREFTEKFEELGFGTPAVAAVIFKGADINNDTILNATDYYGLFKYAYDKNQDGYISAEEFVQRFSSAIANLTANLQSIDPASIFDSIDLNDDGKLYVADFAAAGKIYDINGDGIVTESEFIQKYRQLGGSVADGATLFTAADRNHDDILNRTDYAELLQLNDLNKDGYVEKGEFVTVFKQTDTSNNRVNPLDPAVVFAYVDTDNDGKVNFRDFSGAFKVYDLNGDNETTEQEFTQKFEELGLGTAAAAAGYFQGADINNDTILNGTDYWGLFHYAYDANQDGFVSAAEFVKLFKQTVDSFSTTAFDPATIFDSLDLKHDGKLYKADFAAAGKIYDINGDNIVTESEFVQKYMQLGGTTFAAAALFAAADRNHDHILNDTDYADLVVLNDVNRDGYVEKAEFIQVFQQTLAGNVTATLDPADIFAAIDTDKNGLINETDFATALLMYDVNGDNIVTRNEFLPKFLQLGQGDTAEAAGLFAAADTNTDGIVNNTDYENLVKIYDSNKDGYVSESEFVAVISSALAGTNRTTPDPLDPAYIFAGLDPDNNGVIKGSDIAKMLKRYDANGDNKVTKDEFIKGFTESGSGGTGPATIQFNIADYNHDGILNDTDYRGLDQMFDLNKDGDIDRSEFENVFRQHLPRPNFVNSAYMFAGVDTDKDGVFNQTDLTNALLSYDINGDGKVSEKEYVQKFQEFGLGDEAAATTLFASSDGNHDNVLDNTDFVSIFQAVDLNHDGEVTVAEFTNALAVYSSPSRPENLFAGVDTNRDGTFNLTDFSKAMAVYDVNGDGNVTENEFVQKYQALGLGSAARGTVQFQSIDVNSDNILDDKDYKSVFEGLDVNHDGHVTYPEFTAALGGYTVTNPTLLFAGIDRNQDGVFNQTDLARAIQTYDINGDGDVTEQEYVFKYQDLGLGDAGEGERLFNATDSNHDNILNGSDYSNIFQGLDLNHDGEVTLPEFTSVFMNFTDSGNATVASDDVIKQLL